MSLKDDIIQGLGLEDDYSEPFTAEHITAEDNLPYVASDTTEATIESEADTALETLATEADHTDQLEGKIVSLESICLSISEAMDENAFTATTGRMIGIAIEEIYEDITGYSPVVSEDAFKSDLEQSTEVSLEGISDFLESVWKAILKVFKAIYDNTIGLVLRLFGFAQNSEAAFKIAEKKHADAIKQKQGLTPGQKKWFDTQMKMRTVTIDTVFADMLFVPKQNRISQNVIADLRVTNGFLNSFRRDYVTLIKDQTTYVVKEAMDGFSSLKKKTDMKMPWNKAFSEWKQKVNKDQVSWAEKNVKPVVQSLLTQSDGVLGHMKFETTHRKNSAVPFHLTVVKRSDMINHNPVEMSLELLGDWKEMARELNAMLVLEKQILDDAKGICTHTNNELDKLKALTTTLSRGNYRDNELSTFVSNVGNQINGNFTQLSTTCINLATRIGSFHYKMVNHLLPKLTNMEISLIREAEKQPL